MTGVVSTPRGVDLCRTTVNTPVGLAVVAAVEDGGGVPDLELVDTQRKVQMLRGTESEYLKVKIKKGLILDSFLQFRGKKRRRKERWPSEIP